MTYEIARYSKNKPIKQKFVSGSEEHRKFILRRNVEAVRSSESHQLGKAFYVPGRHEKGIIISVIEDIKYVEWEGLKAKFLELYFAESMITKLYHPSDLRKHK